MEKYHFRLLKKCVIWEETQFAIETETLEDAKLKAINFYNDPNDFREIFDYYLDQELLLETLSGYEPEDDIYPTKELYSCDTDKLIISDKNE